MNPINGLHINGQWLSRESILSRTGSELAELSEPLQDELYAFLHAMLDEQPTLALHSSGSTGSPKTFYAPKSALIASAVRSCHYFDLREGQRVLLRLPLNYIAAKMMIIRCLVANLHLELRPAQTQLFDESISREMRIDFCPIVTLQAAQNSAEDLNSIKTLLLGGGFIPNELEAKLNAHPGAVYASYGMTETYSHIALRRLNGLTHSRYYTPLPHVELANDDEGRLIINDTLLGINQLHTNDIVTLHPHNQLEIHGRSDNIINSSGIKIQSESIEQRLYKACAINCAALPYPHPRLGECVALLWEGSQNQAPLLEHAIHEQLSAYEQPKYLCHSSSPLPRTESHKIDRRACQKLLNLLISSQAGSSCLI